MTDTFRVDAQRSPALSAILVRVLIAVAALAAIAGVFALVSMWWATPTAAPSPRHPFSAGLQEKTFDPAGLGSTILAIQSAFYARMISVLQGFAQSASAIWTLIALSFAYGVFHAAGPGHGKAVIAGYLVADSRRSLKRGLGLALASSLLQAVSAIAIVGVLAALFNATTHTINTTAQIVEQASFALVALVGFIMLWRKAGKLTALSAKQPDAPAQTITIDSTLFSGLAFQPTQATASGRFRADEVNPEDSVLACQHPSCTGDGCAHLLLPEELNKLGSLREMAMVALSAGLRPCSGAIIVLVFALTQGLLAAGIAAVFAMAVGTFITVGALASLAVFAKRFAAKLAGTNTRTGTRALAVLEVLASALIAMTGLLLAFGQMQAGS